MGLRNLPFICFLAWDVVVKPMLLVYADAWDFDGFRELRTCTPSLKPV